MKESRCAFGDHLISPGSGLSPMMTDSPLR